MATKEDTEDFSGADDGERGHWRNPFEFLLSTLGYAIGMGSLWRFPYLAQRNGGGAFLVPYVIFAIIFGVPLFFMESVLGQYFQRSPILAFDICPLFKGIGATMCVLSLLTTVYYMTVMAWALYYLYSAFSQTLPWTTCGNPWNTNSCLPLHNDGNWSFNSTGDVWKPVLATEEFWQRNVLRRSDGVEDVGGIQSHLALSLLIGWTCIFICICKGITSSRIAVYITATLPLLLLIVMCAWTATFPGAVDGMLVYITPKWEKMANYQVWIEAFLQVFYSLGPSWGGIITLSSYNPFHHNCIRDSVIVTFADTVTAIFCGFVIFSGLGYMANQAGVPVLDVVSSGPGLSFVTYPQVVSTMPLPQLWASLFFILLFFLGIDSAFGMIKTMTCGLFDLYPNSLGNRKALVTAIVCGGCYIVGLLFITEGGVYIFQLVDWYLTFFAIMLIALLECIVVGYIYGIDRFLRHVKEILGHVNGGFLLLIKYSLKFSVPFVMAICLLFTIVTFRSPTYGDYKYPDWTNVFGWMLAVSLTFPIPGFFIYQIKHEQGTIIERLRKSVQPRIGKKGRQLSGEQATNSGETELPFLEKKDLDVYSKEIEL